MRNEDMWMDLAWSYGLLGGKARRITALYRTARRLLGLASIESIKAFGECTPFIVTHFHVDSDSDPVLDVLKSAIDFDSKLHA
jgi:hypothetical protein